MHPHDNCTAFAQDTQQSQNIANLKNDKGAGKYSDMHPWDS